MYHIVWADLRRQCLTDRCELPRSRGMLLQTGKLFLFSEWCFKNVPAHTVRPIYVNFNTALEGHRNTLRIPTTQNTQVSVGESESKKK